MGVGIQTGCKENSKPSSYLQGWYLFHRIIFFIGQRDSELHKSSPRQASLSLGVHLESAYCVPGQSAVSMLQHDLMSSDCGEEGNGQNKGQPATVDGLPPLQSQAVQFPGYLFIQPSPAAGRANKGNSHFTAPQGGILTHPGSGATGIWTCAYQASLFPHLLPLL